LQPLGQGPGVQGIVQKLPPLPGNRKQSFEEQSLLFVHAAPKLPAAASGGAPESWLPPPSPHPGPWPPSHSPPAPLLLPLPPPLLLPLLDPELLDVDPDELPLPELEPVPPELDPLELPLLDPAPELEPLDPPELLPACEPLLEPMPSVDGSALLQPAKANEARKAAETRASGMRRAIMAA
jgi:hypothetical protein